MLEKNDGTIQLSAKELADVVTSDGPSLEAAIKKIFKLRGKEIDSVRSDRIREQSEIMTQTLRNQIIEYQKMLEKSDAGTDDVAAKELSATINRLLAKLGELYLGKNDKKGV